MIVFGTALLSSTSHRPCLGENSFLESDKAILAVLGSPRRGGNSDTLALEFLKGASSRGYSHRLLVPTDLGIAPCDGDNRCFADGECVIRDGMNQIYEKVLSSRYLLLVTPVYFMGPPGSLKSFMDRFQAVWARTSILKTLELHPEHHKAFAIVVCASRDDPAMYRPALSIIKAFLNVIGFTYAGEIIASGLDKPIDAKRQNKLLEQAFLAGKDFVP